MMFENVVCWILFRRVFNAIMWRMTEISQRKKKLHGDRFSILMAQQVKVISNVESNYVELGCFIQGCGAVVKMQLPWLHSSFVRRNYIPEVTNLFGTESCFLVQIHAKGHQFDTYTSEIKFAKFVFNHVIINKN